MAPMEYLGAWGTVIYEKNQKSKISCQTPFKSDGKRLCGGCCTGTQSLSSKIYPKCNFKSVYLLYIYPKCNFKSVYPLYIRKSHFSLTISTSADSTLESPSQHGVSQYSKKIENEEKEPQCMVSNRYGKKKSGFLTKKKKKHVTFFLLCWTL